MRFPEGRARALLVVLVLLPLGFLPGMLRKSPPERLVHRKTPVSQLVITAGVWPLGGEAALDELDARASRIRQCYAPGADPARAAAGLFTGRWPSSGGLLDATQRLPSGTWSLASGARALGWRTAALLEEPLVSRVGLEGFEEVREQAELGPQGLADAALASWRRFADEPSLVWIHLADAGPEGAAVAALLTALEVAPGGLDAKRRVETAIVVTALGSGALLDVANDAGLRVPLYFVYPADLLAGRRSRGSFSLVDLPAAICDVTGIAPPAMGFDARSSIQRALQGRDVFEWCLLLGPDWHVLRNKRQRLTAPGAPADGVVLPVMWELAEPDQDLGFTASENAGAARALYVRALRELRGP